MALTVASTRDPAIARLDKTEIDRVTSSSCPKDRDSMLTILKMTSLREALD
jgi:hypothetical protein